MGCDGGTIPKRCELVKEKKKKEKLDRSVELAARWLLCALSQVQLRMPIVACEMGMLYNKEAVLEFLLDRSKYTESSERFTHLKSLKDVHTLKLTSGTESSTDRASSSNESSYKFICPISQLQLNGKYKFLYPVRCGCVFAERALREILSSNKDESNELPCPVCGVVFNHKEDLITLNPEPGADQDEARKQMERRRAVAKLQKKKEKAANGSKRSSDALDKGEVPLKKNKSASALVSKGAAPMKLQNFKSNKVSA